MVFKNRASLFTALALWLGGAACSGGGGEPQSVAPDPDVPQADFTAGPRGGIAPLSVSFTDGSTGDVTSYTWHFGDSGTSSVQDPTHVYTDPGTYTVTLVAAGPKGFDTRTHTDYIAVRPGPVADFEADVTLGPAPLMVGFTDLSSGPVTAYLWDFGDGGTSTFKDPAYSYANVGTYTVTLTTNGPDGSASEAKADYVVVAAPPSTDFQAGPTIGPAPLTVGFVDQTQGLVTSYAWDFGDGGTSTLANPTHVYASTGTYTVALTTAGPGGATTETRAGLVTVVDPPTADFTADRLAGAPPLAVTFTDASTGPISSRLWSFGDGGSSSAVSPVHTYTSEGTYTVSLALLGPGGSDTATVADMIVVANPPTASFAATPRIGAAPLAVSFEDGSTGNVTSYAWDFGDGATSTLADPMHTYAGTGTYTVSLTATGPGGADTDTRTGFIVVADPPVAGFTADQLVGAPPLVVSFSDVSMGLISAHQWTFGDGGTSSEVSPVHTYTAEGTYTVAQTVIGPGGSDTATLVDMIVVASPPSASFDAAPRLGAVPLAVDFTDSSTGNVTSYAWDFGDGGASTLASPSYTFTNAGTYTVALTVTGPGGSDTRVEVDHVVVAGPPVADFTASPQVGGEPLLVSFTDASTGNVTSHAWDFGDGGTSTVGNPTHTYTTPGTFTVSLMVSGPGGTSTETKSDYVTVSASPVADFDAVPVTGEAPLAVSFADASTGRISSRSWDFGDGGSSTSSSPTHVYTDPGTYTVSLLVTGPGGSDSRTRSGLVTVTEPLPEFAIEFGMNPSFHNWTARGIVFADAMTRASEFFVIRNGNLTSELAPVIPLTTVPQPVGAGWPDFGRLQPGEGAGSFLFLDMQGTIPDGRVEPYVLTWEGSGDCELLGTAVVGEGARVPGRVEVFIDPTLSNGNSNVAWSCLSSDPADPVRNVHVWLPGTEATRPLFWEPFVEKLQQLNLGQGPSSWRTLDWNRINHYGAEEVSAAFTFNYAGRILPSSPSQGTRRGMCVEYQVALCNRLGMDLHFQVPHPEGISQLEYDQFVVDALRRIRDGSPAVNGINGGQPFAGLDPSLSITLELSNEIWNPTSPSFTYYQDEAARTGMSVHKLIADDLAHVWQIAEDVFSAPGTPTLRRFLGAFIGNPAFAQQILDNLPAGTRVDAIGPAAYFGPPSVDVDAWLAGAAGDSCPSCPDAAGVIASARTMIPTLGSALRSHRVLCDGYVNPDGSNPRLELYEAGQSFLAGSSPWRNAAQGAQMHPDLYYAYIDDLIPTLVAEGVDLVHWYSFMTEQTPATGISVGFGIFDDMSQTITLPVPEPYVHEGLPKAAAIYRGPPRR